MKTKRVAARNIDAYIAGFPPKVQALLKQLRTAILRAAPGAEETISYQIPAFRLAGKNLIYFAAFSKHIGLYPAPRGAVEFKDELAAYAGGKGTVQFPLDKPLPLALVRRIVKYRARQNMAVAKPTKAKAKKKATRK